MFLLAVTHSIYSSQWIPLHFFCRRLFFVEDEFLLGFCFLWCFLVDKVNVRSCVSLTATTRQTPVVGLFICCFSFLRLFFMSLWIGVFSFFYFFIYFFIFYVFFCCCYCFEKCASPEDSFYLLGKGGYVFGSVGLFVCLFVCLSVCLSVDNITQKVMNRLGWNFMDGSWVVQWRTD